MINRERYPSLNVISLEEFIGQTTDEDMDYEVEGWQFGVEFSKEDWTLATFMERPSVFRFDDPAQRSAEAWTLRKKSEGIASILMNIELGPVKAQRKSISKKRIRNVIDGGNRLNMLKDFVKNLWATGDETYIFGYKDDEKLLIDISACYFKDLPKVFRNTIMSYPFQVHVYEMDDEMKNEMSYRWNNYEPHTNAELMKSQMSTVMQVTVNKMLSMEFAKVGYHEKTANRAKHMEPLLQGFALIETGNDTKLKANVIKEMLERNRFSAETVYVVDQVADYLEEVFHHFEDPKLIKQIFNRKHQATLMYVGANAISLKHDPSHFANWAKKFFVENIELNGYLDHSGDANAQKVQSRNEIALSDFQSTHSLVNN
ncbi:MULTISPECIES: hypothetical protein [Paenibacillus]|uniref:hypothetical protein n=1 Tax=Paenibacillus TaxID=44249 RepID=UPI00042023AD|nr:MULTISPECIES: hypothetical protein [Paenibacillus]KGP78119.1 hypothetical protein P364_0130155 [Paenibacillus sp. MAEPY2]KGP89359.1 hypothetical protein P363_0101495 [Paenibacillus sp. MAEPY1]OZQ71091.1 hypothetical protein CA599_11190 [Paenibacillus taichungensis]